MGSYTDCYYRGYRLLVVYIFPKTRYRNVDVTPKKGPMPKWALSALEKELFMQGPRKFFL